VGQNAKTRVMIGTIGAALLLSLSGQAQAESGAELFQAKCFACHTVGGGKRVGPDLLGIGDRRSESWLIEYIKSPQAMVDKGDPDAKAAFAAFAPVVMPDQEMTDEQIRAVLEYIASDAAKTKAAPRVVGTPEEIELGKNLFQGLTRFEGGGPTCTSCHNVKMKDDMVISGGILAAELTDSFSRLGGADAVANILQTRPFPVMQQAYAEAPLTETEVKALVAFLEKADRSERLDMPLDMGVKLFGAGLLGVFLLLGFYSLVWSGRKRESVNQAIFDRQINSI
jgi:mono/diheme cytochrome c family protein